MATEKPLASVSSEELALWPKYYSELVERVLGGPDQPIELISDSVEAIYRSVDARFSRGQVNVAPRITGLDSPLAAARSGQMSNVCRPAKLVWLAAVEHNLPPGGLSPTPNIVSTCLSADVFRALCGGETHIFHPPFAGNSKFEEEVCVRGFLAELCHDELSEGFLPLVNMVRHCGWWWWAFEDEFIYVRRPIQLIHDSNGYLHSETGPAIVFCDGVSGYFWHGLPVTEEILHEPRRLAVTIKRSWGERSRLIDAFGTEEFEAAVRVRLPRKEPPGESPLLRGALPSVEAIRSKVSRLPLLDRYVAGEGEAVWAELVAMGSKIREDPYAADAIAVAVETMTRARKNIEVLITRLKQMKYRFMGKPHVPPQSTVQKHIASIERIVGPLPVSVRAAYQIIGTVNLMGGHKRLNPYSADSDYTPDPLVIMPVEHSSDEVKRNEDYLQFESHYDLAVSPDELSKHLHGGGRPYSVRLPNPNADAMFDHVASAPIAFVSYLRHSLMWGGFPGWEGDDEAPTDLLEGLFQDFLPI